MRLTPTTRATAFFLGLALMSGCPAAQNPAGDGTPKPVGKRSTLGHLESPSPSPTASSAAGQTSPSPSPSPTASAGGASPSPSPSGSASPSASPSATTSTSPGPSASPTATPTPTPKPLVVSTVVGVATEPGVAEGLGVSADGTDKGVARLFQPSGLAFDKNGALLVVDSGNHRIRKLTFDSGGRATVATLAGSSSGDAENADPLQAQFKSPTSLAVDLATNDVYVADTGNQKIKKIAAGGGVTTVAGSGNMGTTNGPGSGATFTFPRGLAIDGSTLYVTDTESNAVRKVDLAATTHDVSTYVGVGATVAPTPGLTFPFALAIDASKNLYLAEQGSSVVRKISAGGTVTLLGGTSGSTGYADGAAASSKFDFFNYGAGLAVGTDGTVYVADSGNVVIRSIKDGQVGTFAGSRVFSDEASHLGLPPGDGPAASAKFNSPIALAIAADGAIYVADRENNCVRRIKR